MGRQVLDLPSDIRRPETNDRVVLTDYLIDKQQGLEIKDVLKIFSMGITGIAVLAGPLIFLAVTIGLESIQPGYDRIYDTISKLVWGQYGWVQTLCFYLFAFVLASLALNLHQFGNGRKSISFAISLITLLSGGFIIIAILPTNAPGAPATLTVFIHRFTAGIICFLFPIVCLSVATGLRGNSSWRKIRTFSLVTGGLGVVLSLLGILVIMTESPYKGALERLMLINGILWIEVMEIWLLFNFHRSLIRKSIRLNEFPGKRSIPVVVFSNDKKGAVNQLRRY